MKWTHRFTLKFRVFLNIFLLLALTLGVGLTSVWHASQFSGMLAKLVNKDIVALEAARGLQTALANHKGFATYYFLDGDPKWLEQLRAQRRDFQEWLKEAYSMEHKTELDKLLRQIENKYHKYIHAKDTVIALYKSDRRDLGEKQHWAVRSQFFELNDLCRQYEKSIQENMLSARRAGYENFRRLTAIVVTLVLAALGLGILLCVMLVTQVLAPIRRLTQEAATFDDAVPEGDEVRALSRRVHGLMEDMDRTRSELQQSKELLMNSEKMALVGKLATEVAHSIRNPMTSINMRLFSLARSLDLNPTQKEDFDVVSEEMRRLDNIVRNFLEFSRPHKLHKQRLNICDVISMTLDLLSYRLNLHSVAVNWTPDDSLPKIEADPELLKEVFVNIVVNACEAMGNGGDIEIEAEAATAENIGRAVIIRVKDSGPGMTEDVQARVLEPFETTKADGTGLGLFIVVRIVEEHGGRLELISAEGKGTTFRITLPAVEEGSE